LDIPDITAIPDDHLLCEPLYVGICGSDKRVYAGEMSAANYPRIPGHEVVARVVESRVARFSLGTIIAVDPYHNCGECYACGLGKPNACERNQTYGVQRDGLMREPLVLPSKRAITLPYHDA